MICARIQCSLYRRESTPENSLPSQNLDHGHMVTWSHGPRACSTKKMQTPGDVLARFGTTPCSSCDQQHTMVGVILAVGVPPDRLEQLTFTLSVVPRVKVKEAGRQTI